MNALTRRTLIKGVATTIGASMLFLPTAIADDSPDQWVHKTRYINRDHPRITETAQHLARSATDNLNKALAIFSFVRDEIKFGFTRGFWDNKASDVLASGVGYCNTKSTLFMALLRAADIPARQVFVDIHASVLDGIIGPGTPYVDHSYVEVFLNGTWVATDAYIADSALFEPAQERVKTEGRLMGYGVHLTGTNMWDGRNPSFTQFNRIDPRQISTRHWGIYEDVGDFYKRAERPWNRLNPLLRAGFGTLSSSANRRADQVRDSKLE